MSRRTLITSRLSPDRIVQVGDGFCLVETRSARRFELYLKSAAAWRHMTSLALLSLRKAGLPIEKTVADIDAALQDADRGAPVMVAINHEGNAIELWSTKARTWRQIRRSLMRPAFTGGAR